MIPAAAILRLSQVTALSGTETVVARALASIPLRLVASVADGRRQEQGAGFGGVATKSRAVVALCSRRTWWYWHVA